AEQFLHQLLIIEHRPIPRGGLKMALHHSMARRPHVPCPQALMCGLRAAFPPGGGTPGSLALRHGRDGFLHIVNAQRKSGQGRWKKNMIAVTRWAARSWNNGTASGVALAPRSNAR